MKSPMSGLITLSVLCGVVYAINPDIARDLGFAPNDAARVQDAYHARESNILVEVEGRVALELPDIEDRARLQRFLLELENGHRLEVSHNVDLSEFVPLGVNSLVRVKGEFDWTPNGGIIHWTHADPERQREGGWISYGGQRYD